MTISSEVRKAGPFTGNGTASAFPFAFKVFKAADLIVVQRQLDISTETQLVLNRDYTVVLNHDQNANPGGTITLTSGALASGITLVISSDLPYLQPTDLTNQGGFYPAVITNALDRLTIFCQQLAERMGRSLKLPITAPNNISTELPLPGPKHLLAWNEDGSGLTTLSPQSLVTSIAYGSATADLFTGDGTTKTFPLTTNPASVNNLDVSVEGKSVRPGIDYQWNGGPAITFTVAPGAPSVAGDKNVLVRYMQAVPVSDAESLHAQTFEALRRSYAEAGYNLVQGSFEKGGVLTSTNDVLLYEKDGKVYSWTGAYPSGGHVVSPGDNPITTTGFVDKSENLYRDTSPVISFSEYGPIAGQDCSDLLEKAIHDAQITGATLDLGRMHLTLTGKTINALAGKSLTIKGEAPYCIIDASGWSNKTDTNNHNITAKTLFVCAGGDSGVASRTNDFHLSGVSFVNKDSSVKTRFIYATGTFRNVNISSCDFKDFTVVSAFGTNILSTGKHPNSDALTAIDSATYYNCHVQSDSFATGQCPKAFHTYHALAIQYLMCNLYGYGDGYVVRSDGGHFDTIPTIGRGANSVKMSMCHVYSEASSEYCQATKTVGITITCNTADASNGDKPDNFWDLFNCFGVTFSCNTVRGGGLLFHGHGDLNYGIYPNNLIGSYGLSAVGNTLINPTHDSVFNLGGDGTVDGNRAYHTAVIADNTVYCEPGFIPPQDCAFVFSFLCNDISLHGNNINGIGTYFRTFYCKNVVIENETLRNVPKEIDNTGNDSGAFSVGTINRFGTTGSTSKFSGSLLAANRQVSRKIFESGIDVSGDAKISGLVYEDKGDSGYTVGGSVTLNLPANADCGVYEINFVLIAYAGSASVGKFVIVVSGGNVMQKAPIIDNTSVTIDVTANGAAGTTIKLTNNTGQQRTLRAYAIRFVS